MWKKTDKCELSGGLVSLKDTIIVKSTELLLEEGICDSEYFANHIHTCLSNAYGNQPLEIEIIFLFGNSLKLKTVGIKMISDAIFFMKNQA